MISHRQNNVTGRKRRNSELAAVPEMEIHFRSQAPGLPKQETIRRNEYSVPISSDLCRIWQNFQRAAAESSGIT